MLIKLPISLSELSCFLGLRTGSVFTVDDCIEPPGMIFPVQTGQRSLHKQHAQHQDN